MKTISSLLCSLFVFVPIYAATNPIQKNMALFFDFKLEEQEGRGPLTAECAEALKNKENIDAIILNKGLWNNIVQVYMLDKTTVSAYWEIYEQDSFIIVVPKEITTPLNLSGAIKLDESNAFPSESFFSSLKNDSLSYLYNKFPLLLSYSSSSIKPLLSKLMQKSKQEHSYWNIYFSGHGSSVFQTAGITENSFKDLLYFFEHDTKIRSLYYSSCYAGGVISKAIFGTSSYSYPIFTEGLENTVYAQNVSAIFKHLMDISPINKNSWQKLAQHSYLRSPYSLLSAREPGKSSFSTILVAVDRFYMPYNGEVKTFTSLPIFPLNETIKQEDLDKFEYNPDASQLPELYVLETTRFSPTLSFWDNSSKIISAVRGNICNYLEKISFLNLESFSYSYIADCLEKVFIKQVQMQKNTKKIFLIKTISCVNTKGESGEIKNCIVFVHDDISYAPKILTAARSWHITITNPISIFFDLGDNNGFLWQRHSESNTSESYLNENKAKTYRELFSNYNALLIEEKQPEWRLENFIQHPITRKAFPFIISSASFYLFYLRIKQEAARAKTYSKDYSGL